jgi:hypothetical protein
MGDNLKDNDGDDKKDVLEQHDKLIKSTSLNDDNLKKFNDILIQKFYKNFIEHKSRYIKEFGKLLMILTYINIPKNIENTNYTDNYKFNNKQNFFIKNKKRSFGREITINEQNHNKERYVVLFHQEDIDDNDNVYIDVKYTNNKYPEFKRLDEFSFEYTQDGIMISNPKNINFKSTTTEIGKREVTYLNDHFLNI